MDQKSLIRNEMICIRSRLSEEDIEYTSKIITTKFLESLTNDIKTIGIYVSFHNEVDTIVLIKELFKRNIKVCCPKVRDNEMDFIQINDLSDLASGKFGLLEPTTNILINKEDIDLLVVPIVAYNSNNYRIGYGKGYYDRYLNGYRNKTVGFAYKFQRIEQRFEEKFDQKLQTIITN